MVIKKHEYREVVEPLVSFIESDEFCTTDKDIVTVVIPQFTSQNWWGEILHNQTAVFLKQTLLKRPNIAVITVPFIIKAEKK
ncbi:hypothetical protein D3C73_1406960 [compost metagenome]